MQGKFNLFHLTISITAAIDMKMGGSAIEDKSSFNIWDCLSLLSWIWALTLSVKQSTRILET